MIIDYKKQNIWLSLMRIGAKTGCHQRADRSFSLGNYQFPVCARCTGIMASIPMAYILNYFKQMKIWIAIVLVIPMTVDGTLQKLEIKESNNVRRFLTGLLAGLGLVSLRIRFMVSVIDRICNMLKDESNKK